MRSERRRNGSVKVKETIWLCFSRGFLCFLQRISLVCRVFFGVAVQCSSVV